MTLPFNCFLVRVGVGDVIFQAYCPRYLGFISKGQRYYEVVRNKEGEIGVGGKLMVRDTVLSMSSDFAGIEQGNCFLTSTEAWDYVREHGDSGELPDTRGYFKVVSLGVKPQVLSEECVVMMGEAGAVSLDKSGETVSVSVVSGGKVLLSKEFQQETFSKKF